MVSKFNKYDGTSEYRGLKDDTKPVANNGDKFHEIDTGKDFMFNESTDEWKEQPKKGGGGGGGGALKVTFDVQQDGSAVTADKTFEELYQAVRNGAYVYAVRPHDPAIYHLMSAFALEVSFSRVSVSDGTEVMQEVLAIASDNNAVFMIRRYPN